MGFFDIFKTTSRRNSTGSSTTDASSTTPAPEERRRRSGKKKRTSHKTEKVETATQPANELPVVSRKSVAPKEGLKQADSASAAAAIETAKKYWAASHAQDFDELKKCCEARCFMNFLDTEVEMPLSEYLESWKATLESFPDFTLEMNLNDVNPAECRTPENTDDGTTIVYIRNVRAKGTHTGKPYSFGPFPEVPAKGTFVRDVTPNTNAMRIRNGKVYRIDVKMDESGGESGPAYFYEQVGGILF